MGAALPLPNRYSVRPNLIGKRLTRQRYAPEAKVQVR